MCFEYVKKSWKIYSNNPFPFVIGAALSTVVTIVGFMLASFVLTGSFLDIFMNDTSLLAMQFNNLATGFFVLAVTIVANIIIMSGLYGMAEESIRKKTSIETMIKTIKGKSITILAASIMVMMIAIASVIPMITVIIFANSTGSILEAALMIISVLFFLAILSLFSLVYPAVIENKKAIDALLSSVRTVKHSYLQTISLLLIFVILSLLLGWIPYAGSVLTTFIISPCSYIAFTMFYQKKKKK